MEEIETITYTFRLPKALLHDLKEAANAEHRKPPELMREIIRSYLKEKQQ